jgi:hypothetical protein
MSNWIYTNVSGTHVEFSWRNDATVGRAGQLRAKLTATGAANDQGFVYQSAPIPPAGSTAEGAHFVNMSGSCTSWTGGLLYIKAQYYKADGVTTTGTEAVTEAEPLVGDLSTQGFQVSPNVGVQPTDAAYLRVKIGIRRPGIYANTTTMQVELYAVNVIRTPRWLVFGQGTQMGILGRATDIAGGSGITLSTYDPSFGDTAGAGINVTATAISMGLATTFTDTAAHQGLATFANTVRWSAAITPSISAGQNDWNPAGWSSGAGGINTISVTLDAARTVTGLAASNVTQGDMVILQNVTGSGGALTLANESASSVAANRFRTNGNANVSLQPGGAVLMWYAGTRWHTLGL